MKVTVSDKTLRVKPQKWEIGKYLGKEGMPNRIKFMTSELHIEDFENIISRGHTLAYLYIDDDVMGNRKKNYIGTDFIIIDIDATDLTIDEVLGKASYKPTIIHTTLSNLTKNKNFKYCYHLIYCMTDTLCGEENFNYAFSHFCSGIEDLIDKNAKDCHRIIFTSNSALPNYQYRFLGNTYSAPNIVDALNEESITSDLSFSSKDELSVKKINSSSIFNTTYNMKVEERKLTDYNVSFELSKDFISNLNRMDRSKFLRYYNSIYDYITFTQPTVTNITAEGIVYADYRGIDYYELPSLWRTNEYGERERKKIEIGGRTKQLYIETNLFLLIKPDITKEHLVYEVVRDVYENYNNADGQFNNHYILSLVESVWKSREDFAGHPIPKSFKIIKYADGISKQSCVGIVRRMMKDESIGSVIDINLSVEENLAELKKMGVKIKKNRLMQFIKGNHLEAYIKTDKQIKEEQVTRIVKSNINASLRTLAKMCKEQNVVVSHETIRKIKQEIEKF